MPIDWFTVVAQVINFMILVWLLKRFLYKPILNAIDERERGIARQLADAEAKKSEAMHERDDFLSKNEKFDKQRAELLKHASDEAKAERQRILAEARKDADTLRLKLQESLRSEQLHLSEEIVRWTHKEIIATARKALADLASESLEERMSEVFVLRFRELTVEKKEQLAAALKRSNDSVRVRSAFNLSPVQQNVIEKAIRDSFAADIHVQFETVPELVSGIELVTDGQKVAWSITDYFATLERSLGQLLHFGAAVDAKLDQSTEPGRELEVMTSPPKVNH
jgi:F-type H+-transporting ATPase subunit b